MKPLQRSEGLGVRRPWWQASNAGAGSKNWLNGVQMKNCENLVLFCTCFDSVKNASAVSRIPFGLTGEP